MASKVRTKAFVLWGKSLAMGRSQGQNTLGVLEGPIREVMQKVRVAESQPEQQP